MNELPKKLDDFIKEMKLSLNRKEVVQLMTALLEHYDISLEEIKANAPDSVSEKKATTTASAPTPTPSTTDMPYILPGVGVVLPSNKVLYYDGSENKGTRSQAYSYKKLKLPKGYRWRLMNSEDLKEIHAYEKEVNKLLRKLHGVAMFAIDEDYILEDNDLNRGYVRYLADLE